MKKKSISAKPAAPRISSASKPRPEPRQEVRNASEAAPPATAIVVAMSADCTAATIWLRGANQPAAPADRRPRRAKTRR